MSNVRITIEVRELANDLETFSNIIAPYRAVGRGRNQVIEPHAYGCRKCFSDYMRAAIGRQEDEISSLAEKLIAGDLSAIIDFLQNAIEEDDNFSIDAQELLERVCELCEK